MKKLLEDYIIRQYRDVPISIYEALVAIFCIGAVMTLTCFGIKKGLRYFSVLLFVEYLFLIFYKTLFARSFNEKQGYDFHPFWSYSQEDLLPEIIMNIVVFVPVGLLLGCACRSMKWWMVLLIGGGASVGIEMLQYFYKRGFAETDDVMHNTLGCLIGYGLYSFVRYGYERINKRTVGVL